MEGWGDGDLWTVREPAEKLRGQWSGMPARLWRGLRRNPREKGDREVGPKKGEQERGSLSLVGVTG